MNRYNPAAIRPQPLGLAIFDCDGALVDSEPLPNQMLVEMVHYHGFDLDEPVYLRKFSGIPLPNRIQTTAAERVSLSSMLICM